MDEEIIKEIADELDLSELLIEKVIKSEFQFVKECMENKSNVHLHYLGKFVIKPGRVYKIEENAKKRAERETDK